MVDGEREEWKRGGVKGVRGEWSKEEERKKEERENGEREKGKGK